MRYLKVYETKQKKYFTQEDLDDIKDVFQDIVDEYDIILAKNIEEFRGEDEFENIPEDNYYRIKLFNNDWYIASIDDLADEIDIILFTSLSSKISKDIDSFIKRLTLMGFRCYRNDRAGEEIRIKK